MSTQIEHRKGTKGHSGIGAVLLQRLRHAQQRALDTQSGKIGWAILWLLGIPLPVLLIAYLIWGR